MWWFESSSFSKSTGARRKPAREEGGGKDATMASTSSSSVNQLHIPSLSQLLTSVVLGDRLVLVDLNLDTALWHEFRNVLGLNNFSEDRRIALAREAVVECVQVGGGDEVLEMKRLMSAYPFGYCAHVINVELERVRCSLGSGPERSSIRVDLVLWQVKEQLLDLVDIVALELQSSPLDTLRESRRALLDKVLLDLLQLIVVLTRRLERGLDKVRLRQVEVDRCWGVDV